MRAFVLRSYGSSLDLTSVGRPEPAADEVLVRVRATSVQPYDWHHLSGEPYLARLLPGTLGLRRPKIRILGADLAGQVEAVGKSVTQFRPGDDVFALLPQGCFAEYVCAPERLLAAMPKNPSTTPPRTSRGTDGATTCWWTSRAAARHEHAGGS